MSSTHDPQNQNGAPTPERLLKDGFLPLVALAEKHGYARDHIGRLARTGRVQATRFGNSGDWYVNEASLDNYRREMSERRLPPPVVSVPAHVGNVEPEVPSVLFNEEGSLNAEPRDVQSSPRGQYAILTLALVLGGIFVSLNLIPIDRNGSLPIDRNANILELIGRPFSILYDLLFRPIREPENYLVYDSLKAPPVSPSTTPQISSPPIPPSTPGNSPAPQPRTIERVIITQALDTEELTAIRSGLTESQLRLDAFQAFVLALQNQVNGIHIPRSAFPLASAGTTGASDIVIGPKGVDTETLTVSGNTTLNTLTVSNALTVSGDIAFDSNTLFVDSAANRVGIGTRNLETTFEVNGTASISGQLLVNGNIGIGTTSAPTQLTVVGSGSFTGQLKATRNPTQAHTGTWPNFTGASDATVYINPSSPVADGNVLVYANNGSTRFVVDAEGDVFANNLVLTGSTTQGTTTIAGDLNVEGNMRFGDAPTDAIRIVGTVLPNTLTSNIFTIQASPSWTGDYYARALNSSGDPVFYVASTSAGYFSGNVGIGTTGPGATLHSLSTTEQLRLGYDASNYYQFITDSTGNLSLDHSNGSSVNYVFDSANSTFRPSVGAGLDLGLSNFRWSNLHISTITQTGIFNNSANGVAITLTGTTPTIESTNSELVLRPAGTLSIKDRNASDAVRFQLSSAGNIGIGTTTPTALTHIVGDTATLLNVASGSNSRLVVMESGNIGIGTSAPDAPFHVAANNPADSQLFEIQSAHSSANPVPFLTFRSSRGSVAVPSATQVNDWLGGFNAKGFGTNAWSSTGKAAVFAGAGETWTNSAQGTFLYFETTANGTTSQTERLRIFGSGQVGIGTGSSIDSVPVYLEIKKSDSNAVAMQLSNTATGGRNYRISSTANSSSIGGGKFSIYDTTQGADRLTLDSTGNVGIGTTNPSSVLQLDNNNGNTTYSNNVKLLTLRNTSNNAAAASGAGFEVAAAGDVLGFDMTSNAHISAGGGLTVTQDYANRSGFALQVINNGFSTGSTVRIATVAAGGTTLTNRLSIDAAGRIGINSSNAGSGTIAQSNRLEIQDGSLMPSTSAAANVANMFIGSVSSQANGDTGGSIGFGGNVLTSGIDLRAFSVIRGAKENTTQGDTAGVLELWTIPNGGSFAERMRISSTGNVGIGTTAPTALTHIVGDTATLFNVASGSNSRLAVLENGNVGIGTTNPGGLLHVSNGNVLITGTSTGDSNTALMLHANGTNGSTTFTDSSQTPHTMTANGNAQLSTTQSKFGGASGVFDGTGDYLSTPYNADLDFGSGAFTVDGWFYMTVANDGAFFSSSNYDSATNGVSFGFTSNNLGQIRVSFANGSTLYTFDSSSFVPSGTWTHIAIVRNGTDLRAYINGTSVGSVTVSGAPPVSGSFYVGRISSAFPSDYNGYIDELRVSKGIARWTSNFTPPAAEYSVETTSGRIGIGTTIPELILDAEGDIEVGTGTTGCVRDADNTTIAGTCSSDIRLKTNIQPLSGVLEKLAQLNPVTFDWIDGANQTPNYGLIAQEAEAVLPELVASGSDGFKRVRYDTTLSMMFLKGIQELDANMASLSMRLEEIENRSASGSFADIEPGSAFGDWLTQSLAATRAMLADGSLELVKAVSGVFDKLQANEIIVGDFEADTADVRTLKADNIESRNGITIFDSITGEPVCVVSESGVLKSIPGKCAAATPIPTPATGGTSGGEPSPTPTPQESPPSSEPSPIPQESPPTESASPTPSPAPSPEITASPSPTPTPAPSPESTPEPPPSPDATPAP